MLDVKVGVKMANKTLNAVRINLRVEVRSFPHWEMTLPSTQTLLHCFSRTRQIPWLYSKHLRIALSATKPSRPATTKARWNGYILLLGS